MSNERDNCQKQREALEKEEEELSAQVTQLEFVDCRTKNKTKVLKQTQIT